MGDTLLASLTGQIRVGVRREGGGSREVRRGGGEVSRTDIPFGAQAVNLVGMDVLCCPPAR